LRYFVSATTFVSVEFSWHVLIMCLNDIFPHLNFGEHFKTGKAQMYMAIEDTRKPAVKREKAELMPANHTFQSSG